MTSVNWRLCTFLPPLLCNGFVRSVPYCCWCPLADQWSVRTSPGLPIGQLASVRFAGYWSVSAAQGSGGQIPVQESFLNGQSGRVGVEKGQCIACV
ncbi:hypothetical protein Hamer_G009260 [Homarus americanus]|uniref:Secreted protein n=1 Tax=Homarus americanus TaxID=6706 RepID=A0A8J5J095_HOMAM|nr:hypothetical protein Hamer_G009260 [Homarus americanus]